MKPAVTEKVRKWITGRAMDRKAFSGLLAECIALFGSNQKVLEYPVSSCMVEGSTDDALQHTGSHCFVSQAFEDGSDYCWGVGNSSACAPSIVSSAAFTDTLHCMGVAEEEALCLTAAQSRDVWLDDVLMMFVKKGICSQNLSAAELYRLQQRARSYQIRMFEKDGAATTVLYRVRSA